VSVPDDGWKKIKTKDADILSLKQEITSLTARLDVFTHDPYIKKNQKEVLDTQTSQNEAGEQAVLENNSSKEPEQGKTENSKE